MIAAILIYVHARLPYLRHSSVSFNPICLPFSVIRSMRSLQGFPVFYKRILFIVTDNTWSVYCHCIVLPKTLNLSLLDGLGFDCGLPSLMGVPRLFDISTDYSLNAKEHRIFRAHGCSCLKLLIRDDTASVLSFSSLTLTMSFFSLSLLKQHERT